MSPEEWKGLVFLSAIMGKRGKRLALGARAHDDDLVVGNAVELVGIEDVLLVDVEVSELARHARVGEHRAAYHNILRPHFLAASQICCKRWIWPSENEGNEHAALRVLDDLVDVGPTAASDGVNPGRLALVESDIRRSMPCLANLAMAA